MSTTPSKKQQPKKQSTRSGTKSSGRSGWSRGRILLILGLAILVVGTWLFLPFWQLSGQFGTNPQKQPSRLYGRSPILVSGDGPGLDEVVARLEASGYDAAPSAAASSDVAPARGTYRRGDDWLEIHRRIFPTAAGPTGGDHLRLTFRGRALASLHLDGRRVSEALLDPPLVASFYGAELQERRPMALDELPEDLILAVLAIEDAHFLEHGGVSLRGIFRAMWANLRAKRFEQGGSTLTQQLVKNIYLTHERTLVRKAREAVLALLLEWRYDKRLILQAYLNEIYWGRSGSVHVMGIGAAAWAYFNKTPAQLTLAESALLAGMIQSPLRYSPIRHPEEAKERRDQVLERLAQLNWLDRERLERAALEEVAAVPGRVARQAPYFADAVAEEARRRFGITDLRDAGYLLVSTLDLRDQERAEDAVAWGVGALEKGWEKGHEVDGPLQSALVSIDPQRGDILAYVGGRDYGESQFDRVAHARRQAGSAFKPIVYAAAFAEGVAYPGSILDDEPYTVVLDGREWSPRNSDGTYRGPVSARTALEKSLNVPTARLAVATGMEHVVDMARRMGIVSHLDPYPALSLGAMEITPLELATVYATLAAGGVRPPVHGLDAVFDRSGKRVESGGVVGVGASGEDLPPPQRVMSRQVAFLVTQVLQGVLDRGTAKDVRAQGIQDALAGKTGTTNSRRDSWFAGYSPERATLVWVGYDDNSKTRLSGARAALPIWARFVAGVRPAGGFGAFTPPPGVALAWIDPETGGLATRRCPRVTQEWVLRSSTPLELCTVHGGRPLEQPEGVEVEERDRHPFQRWLDRLRGKGRDGERGDKRDGGRDDEGVI